jgi:hypothetical protein
MCLGQDRKLKVESDDPVEYYIPIPNLWNLVALLKN